MTSTEEIREKEIRSQIDEVSKSYSDHINLLVSKGYSESVLYMTLFNDVNKHVLAMVEENQFRYMINELITLYTKKDDDTAEKEKIESNMHKCPNCMIKLERRGTEMACPMCFFTLIPNQKILPALYAWLSVDRVNGYEGIIAVQMKNGVMMTLTSSNLESIKNMKDIAKTATESVSMNTRLVKFTREEVIDE